MNKMYYLISAQYQQNIDNVTGIVFPMISCSSNLSTIVAKLRSVYYECLHDENIRDLSTNTVQIGEDEEIQDAVIDEDSFYGEYLYCKPYVSFTRIEDESSYYTTRFLIISDEDLICI